MKSTRKNVRTKRRKNVRTKRRKTIISKYKGGQFAAVASIISNKALDTAAKTTKVVANAPLSAISLGASAVGLGSTVVSGVAEGINKSSNDLKQVIGTSTQLMLEGVGKTALLTGIITKSSIEGVGKGFTTFAKGVLVLNNSTQKLLNLLLYSLRTNESDLRIIIERCSGTRRLNASYISSRDCIGQVNRYFSNLQSTHEKYFASLEKSTKLNTQLTMLTSDRILKYLGCGRSLVGYVMGEKVKCKFKTLDNKHTNILYGINPVAIAQRINRLCQNLIVMLKQRKNDNKRSASGVFSTIKSGLTGLNSLERMELLITSHEAEHSPLVASSFILEKSKEIEQELKKLEDLLQKKYYEEEKKTMKDYSMQEYNQSIQQELMREIPVSPYIRPSTESLEGQIINIEKDVERQTVATEKDLEAIMAGDKNSKNMNVTRKNSPATTSPNLEENEPLKEGDRKDLYREDYTLPPPVVNPMLEVMP
jgi:hypothetical protein